MTYKNRVPLLAALSAVFVGLAVYGGVSGNEPLMGLGAAAGFVCLILIPAFANRAMRIRKIQSQEKAIIRFEYDRSEIEEIVTEARREIFKKSKRLSILFCICLAIIFLPFVLFSIEPGSDLPPMLPIALPIVLVPWLSLIIAPMAVERTIRRQPCVSVVGSDYVLITNRYHGVNDRAGLKAEKVRFEKSTDGSMGRLCVCYQFHAYRTPRLIDLWVQIPVPRNAEDEAAQIQL